MKKFVVFAMLLATAFSVGYGVVAEAQSIKGRQPFYGYFRNQFSNTGDHVWAPSTAWPGSPATGCGPSGGNAIPDFSGRSNPKASFISFVKCKLDSNASNTHVRRQDRVGAAFIIQTMRGLSGSQAASNCSSNANCRPTNAEISDWEARVNAFPASQIRWNTNASYTINSMYQGNALHGSSTPNDDTFFWQNVSGRSIVFGSGSSAYALRRLCANPVGDGSIGQLPPAQNFTMSGSTTVNGGTSAQVLPGQQVDFRHSLTNGGPTSTSPTSINWSVPSVGSASSASGNSGTFSNGQTKTPSAARQTFTVPASATPGTQYCSRISFNPRTQSGGSGQSTQRCATVQHSYDLQPRINVVIRDTDGQDVSADGVAEEGYTIEFRYSVRNNGITQSHAVSCTYRQAVHAGYSTAAPTATFTPSGASCPPATIFPRNSTTNTAAESLTGPAVGTNTTICRSFSISPSTHNGGTASTQACVPIVAKPFSRVYGGDVSVGNDFIADASCTSNNNAQVVGWNRRAAGSYAGAGVQYAIFALNTIRDTASALNHGSGGAPAPNGLSFANAGVGGNAANGHFGGHFGSAPCIPDYYGDPTGHTALPDPNLTSLNTGTYFRNGPLSSLGGNVNPGQRITIYVNGDVFINNNIVYPGSWNVGNTPRFQLVARGNIFIAPNVTRLDGIFIAQPNGSTGGVIHTCATAANPLPLDGNLYNTCNNKLTVNGAFVANQVRLLRTAGSLSQGNRADGPPAGGAAGEVFNFNPTLWINQPPSPSGEGGDYDAIINLPPIL